MAQYTCSVCGEKVEQGIAADISLEIENLDNPRGIRYFFWLPWTEGEDAQEAIRGIKSYFSVQENCYESV